MMRSGKLWPRGSRLNTSAATGLCPAGAGPKLSLSPQGRCQPRPVVAHLVLWGSQRNIESGFLVISQNPCSGVQDFE